MIDRKDGKQSETTQNHSNVPALPADSFAGFVDTYEEQPEDNSSRMIQGTLLKFTNEAAWVNRDGDEIEPELRLVVIDARRVVQKWINQKPAETIEVPPGQPFPDVAAMNARCPQTEWGEDFNGKPQGPWQIQ